LGMRYDLGFMSKEDNEVKRDSKKQTPKSKLKIRSSKYRVSEGIKEKGRVLKPALHRTCLYTGQTGYRN
jgi:hypothetical protein